MCELREKRLEQAEQLAEFQKGVELLRKERDGNQKKLKGVEAGLEAI